MAASSAGGEDHAEGVIGVILGGSSGGSFGGGAGECGETKVGIEGEIGFWRRSCGGVKW